MRDLKLMFKHIDYKFIIMLTLITRLIAAVFSNGFGFHDDHFLLMEIGQNWADGLDSSRYLPWNQTNPVPTGHSFFYVGFHFLVLSFLKLIGLNSFPVAKIMFVRLLHAAWSVLIVSYGYKITEKLSNERYAVKVGLLLCLLWIMPWAGARNLVEIVCIPFLLMGVYQFMKADTLGKIFFAGFVMALACSVRFQTSVFVLGMGVIIWIQKNFKQAFVFGLGVIASLIAVQAPVDLVIWGKPFMEMGEYVRYNIESSQEYILGAWYNYILVVMGLLLFMGPFWFFGFLRTYRKYAILFVPTMFFFAFHSYLPAKQERFILPILPMIVILGVIGWESFRESSKFWAKHPLFYKNFLRVFWALNIFLLIVFSFSYSKKTRVESMRALAKYEPTSFIIESSNYDSPRMFPRYYIGGGQWPSYTEITRRNYEKDVNKDADVILFVGEENLKQRMEHFTQKSGKELVFKESFEPSLIDLILWKMNKVNRNLPVFLYTIE